MKVAVVTGGSRGLGLAIVRLLAREGYRVVLAARGIEALTSAVAELTAEGADVASETVDVTDRASVRELKDRALARYGRVDVWINNAGAAGVYGPVERVPEESFIATTRTIIDGTYFGTLSGLDALRASGGGDLINLLGRGDDSPVPLQAAYGSAKAWVRAFTKAVAKETAGSGVRVHAFNPGLVRTEMLTKIDTLDGYADQLQRLPGVVSVIGQSPAEAARPILDLIGSNTVEYRALALPRLVPIAVGNLLAKRRGTAPVPEPLNLTIIDDRHDPETASR